MILIYQVRKFGLHEFDPTKNLKPNKYGIGYMFQNVVPERLLN